MISLVTCPLLLLGEQAWDAIGHTSEGLDQRGRGIWKTDSHSQTSTMLGCENEPGAGIQQMHAFEQCLHLAGPKLL